MVSKANQYSDSCDDDLSSTGSDTTGSLVDFIVSDASSSDDDDGGAAPTEDELGVDKALVVQGRRTRKKPKRYEDDLMKDPAVLELYMQDASPLSSDEDNSTGDGEASSSSFDAGQISSSETISSCSSDDDDGECDSMSRSKQGKSSKTAASTASKSSKSSKNKKPKI